MVHLFLALPCLALPGRASPRPATPSHALASRFEFILTRGFLSSTILFVKPLLAIRSCARFVDRAASLRETWVKEIPPDLDYRFFMGSTNELQKNDVTVLDCGDEYKDLPAKTRAICRWAVEHDYGPIHMIDDDVYLRPERLLAAVPAEHYVGRRRGPSCPCHPYPQVCDAYPGDYCSGFSYWLSPYSITKLADADLDPIETAEDRWVGNVLHRCGIEPTYDSRYAVIPERGLISPKNDLISLCEFKTRAEMLIAHRHFHGLPQDDVSPNSRLRRFMLTDPQPIQQRVGSRYVGARGNGCR